MSIAVPSGPHDGQFDLVHSRILRGFRSLVRDLGGEPDAILLDAGVDPARCEDMNAATYRQWAKVLDTAAHRLGISDFGLRLAKRQGGADVFGPLGTVMRNSRTFGEALSQATSYNAAHSLAARIWKGMTASGSHIFLGHDILVDTLPNRCQAMEQLLLLGHLGAQGITGGRVRARRVHFRHREVSDPQVYRRYFGCDVKFCCTEDGVAYRADDLDCPIVDSSAETFSRASAFIEAAYGKQRPPLAAETRGFVMRRLWTCDCGTETIADALGIHPRTLHRRLRREGTSFQKIKDEVRMDYMLYYLQQTDLELSLISERLGFCEQSAMSHFARHLLDASPSELRANAGERAIAEQTHDRLEARA